MRTCAVLRGVRNATYGWIGELRKRLGSPIDEASRVSLQRRLFMLAATCFSTFDVCPEHIRTIFTCEDDFSIAMQCAVIVHDNMPFEIAMEDPDRHYLVRMIRRHHRLLHDLEPLFSESFPPTHCQTGLLHSVGYDDALAHMWIGHRRGTSSSWYALPKPNSRWISCETEAQKKVHYDLLTGELLIGGKRLGRLPPGILYHGTYTSLFGRVSGQNQFYLASQTVHEVLQRMFDVIPTDILGMDYMTQYTVSGHQVKHCYCLRSMGIKMNCRYYSRWMVKI
jgi:hypothetical protein